MKCVSLGQFLNFVTAVAIAMFCSFSTAFAQTGKSPGAPSATASETPASKDGKKLETATLGGGCFWCLEAVYQRVIGVEKVVSGYAGGEVENPTYEAVCTGRTGHAEVCQVTFDPSVISFEQLLEVFFAIHDPTTLNQQGQDIGTQYRSAIFYDGATQREAAEKMIEKLTEEKKFRKKIVTEITPLPDFYAAEAYHQNYFVTHPGEGYCQYTIAPKVAKFEKLFKEESKMQQEKAAKQKK